MTEPKENPTVDVGNTTIQAFNKIQKQNKKYNAESFLVKGSEKTAKQLNNKVCVYVKTPQDKQTHKYFHPLSIDKQVEDFMGTAELRCPYDSKLMEYWEPIRNYCVIYGSNRGESNAKILFIGRVRGVKQEGYELVIQFQDPYWKFKQNVTQSYAKDNVLNKDGYTIMRLMLEALKFDNYVISDSAKTRLQQVGMDKDGNVTLNRKKLKDMPNLINRLKKSNPSKFVNKDTITNKLKEQNEGNVKNINYTLKYEKPTPIMKKIVSQGEKAGGYKAGKSMYGTNYGAKSRRSRGGSARGSNADKALQGASLCSQIPSSDGYNAMKDIYNYHRKQKDNIDWAWEVIINAAKNAPNTYFSYYAPCLQTLAKHCETSFKAAEELLRVCGELAQQARVTKPIENAYHTAVNNVQETINWWEDQGRNAWNWAQGAWNWLTHR